MTWAEVATQAKITVETLRAIRRGNNEPSALTKSGLERALRWQPGSVARILSGGAPTPIREPRNLPSAEAEARGTVRESDAEDDEPDSPISPYLKNLLESVDQRLAEMNKQIAEAHQEIKELRRERQHDGEDQRRKGA